MSNEILGQDQVNHDAEAVETDNNKPESGGFNYAAMIGDGGALAENWREGLPEAIRGEKCLDSIKTIGTLAQSMSDIQSKPGKRWEAIVDKAIWAVLAAVIAFVLAKIGL